MGITGGTKVPGGLILRQVAAGAGLWCDHDAYPL